MPDKNDFEQLEQLDEIAKEKTLKPTWRCECGWKSSWSVNKTTLTLNPYIPLYVFGKKRYWICPNCKKKNPS